MKTVDVASSKPTIAEILRLAGTGDLILRTSDDREFLVAEVIDVAGEAVLVRQRPGLMRLMPDRFKEPGGTIDQVRAMLGLSVHGVPPPEQPPGEAKPPESPESAP